MKILKRSDHGLTVCARSGTSGAWGLCCFGRLRVNHISFQGEPERCVGGDTTEVRSCMPESRDMFGCMYSHWNFPSEAVSISNYLMVKPILSNMTDSTICYWLISGHDGVNGTIFSYSHGEEYTGNSVAVMGSTAPELGQNFFIFRFATFFIKHNFLGKNLKI